MRRKADLKALEAEHTKEAIRARLAARVKHSYLRDLIYGAVDGTVTTFAVVSGVAGAGLSPGIVVILGSANLIGDGFSMAAGNFLGTRAEEQVRNFARRIEEDHIEKIPDGEREEVRQIFASKGFRGEALEKAVEIITSDRKLWIETMMREELGFPAESVSPLKAAAVTFSAFFAAGLLPLLSFLLSLFFPRLGFNPFLFSAALTGVAFFTVGAFKSRFSGELWYKAGLETLAAGGTAAALAYCTGALLQKIAAV